VAHSQQWGLPPPLHQLRQTSSTTFSPLPCPAPDIPLTLFLSLTPQRGDIHLDKLQSQDQLGSLHRILSGLDVLGQTAWKINTPVLSVIQELQQSSSLPFFNSSSSSSSHLASLLNEDDQETEFDDPLFPSSSSSSPLWEQEYKIEIAKLFSNLVFYLPHSLDFRGRAYPLAPHLSVLGDDLSRSLLVYAEGRQLGQRGWFWLKVHLANVAGGVSKGMSYEERAQYTEDHLEEILDSANDPLGGRGWWRSCGDGSTPWQCLAACVEIRDALRGSKPDEFVSHLPISQVSPLSLHSPSSSLSNSNTL
jgi:DNA-directed RNA polymerase, mitochondrial